MALPYTNQCLSNALSLTQMYAYWWEEVFLSFVTCAYQGKDV